MAFSPSEASLQRVVASIAEGSNAIRAMRDAVGYTIEELSLTSGLSVDEITDLERGPVDVSKLRRIASALHLPEQELVAAAGLADGVAEHP